MLFIQRNFQFRVLNFQWVYSKRALSRQTVKMQTSPANITSFVISLFWTPEKNTEIKRCHVWFFYLFVGVLFKYSSHFINQKTEQGFPKLIIEWVCCLPRQAHACLALGPQLSIVLDEFWQVLSKFMNSKPLFSVKNSFRVLQTFCYRPACSTLFSKALPTLNGGK